MQAVWSYVAFKGYWGGIEAMVFSPMLAFIIVAQAQPGVHEEDGSELYSDMGVDYEGPAVHTEGEEKVPGNFPAHTNGVPHEHIENISSASYIVT